MSEYIFNVTDDSFQKEVLDSSIPVLVDFWAPWCGPCQMIGPILEELAPSNKGRVKFAKVNVDENNRMAAKYGIRSIPMLLFFRDGEIKATHIGALTRAQLLEFIEKSLQS